MVAGSRVVVEAAAEEEAEAEAEVEGRNPAAQGASPLRNYSPASKGK